MTPAEWLAEARRQGDELSPELLAQIAYQSNGVSVWDKGEDVNSAFRESLLRLLWPGPKPSDAHIVRAVTRAEIEYCREESIGTYALHDCTYYLFLLAQVEDFPLLMEAKFGTSFDSRIGLWTASLLGPGEEALLHYVMDTEIEGYDLVGALEYCLTDAVETYGGLEQCIQNWKSGYEQHGLKIGNEANS